MKLYEEPAIEIIAFETEDVMDESTIPEETRENEGPFA